LTGIAIPILTLLWMLFVVNSGTLFIVVAASATAGASAIAGAMLSRLGRLCGAWHTSQAGRYAVALSALLASWVPVLAAFSEGKFTFLFGTAIVVMYVVFLPSWALSALRIDGLRS
jgi:hypothetical protein